MSTSSSCAAERIARHLKQVDETDTPSREVSHCCALVARLVNTFLQPYDVTVTLTGNSGSDVELHCSDIDRTWNFIARRMACTDPSLFLYSPSNYASGPDWVRVDVILPAVGSVNVRARFRAMEKTRRFCCRTCHTFYASLLNARTCVRAHNVTGNTQATAPEAEVPGRRALMAAYWDGLPALDRKRIVKYALDDISTVQGDLLDIHGTILKAMCGTVDGEGLVAALERATEGTMLLPGFSTGAITQPDPNARWEWEAVVAWWAAARLASEAMAHSLLIDETPPEKAPKKKKKKNKNKKKKGTPIELTGELAGSTVVAAVAEACLPWSEIYVFPEPGPDEFDPAATLRFLERRIQELCM